MKKLIQKFEDSSNDTEKRFAARSELLETKNAQLTSQMKDLLQELDNHKEQNKLLLDEIARLVTSMKDIKQKQLEDSTYHKVLADTTQMYEQNQIEISRYRKVLADTTKMYEERIETLNQQLEEEHARAGEIEEGFNSTKKLLREYECSSQIIAEKEMEELQMKLKEMHQLHETTSNELRRLSIENKNLDSEKATLKDELHAVRQTLQVEERRRKEAETKLLNMMKGVPESEDGFEEKVPYMHENITKPPSAVRNLQSSHNSSRSRETILSQRNTISKICEEVGLKKIISLLESEDLDVQIHAVKVVANLAAEDVNQERIVQEGGLDALLALVESSQNTTILRVASGAIANLAMSEKNQGLITNKGGAKLLANAASKTNDPQTLRMVAGAIANLCGNEKLHIVLKEDGAIKALLGITRSGNIDVAAQVARGLANFAKCESRRIMKGRWSSRSLLMEDGALSWLIANLNTTSDPIRRHLELAICHLAQNEENARDFIKSGGLKELIEISDDVSTREDIRSLAKKALRLSALFRGELRAE